MKWNRFVLGIGIGALSAFLFSRQQVNKLITAEDALFIVKQKYKEKGPIEGSWIHMVPETLNKDDLTFKVYRGGITYHTDTKTKQLEFLVEAKSGDIIHVAEQ